MSYKVLFDGNGSRLIRVVGLGDYLPVKDVEQAQAERDALAKEVDAANDRNAELVAERDALAAQIEMLRNAWESVKATDWDKPLDEAFEATSQQCLRDVQAEAGRKGFVAGADAFEVAQILGSDFDVEAAANEHAATVRQGGE